VAQQAAEYEGTTMSAFVSSALAFYLGLTGGARRTARFVLTSGTPENRAALLDGCARAIANAGDQALAAQLAARGKALGLQDVLVSEADIAEEAVRAVQKVRRDPVAEATTVNSG
jgi:hypothetical protein